MKKPSHFLKILKFCAVFLIASFSLVSCEFFNKSTKEYLELYTSKIIAGTPEPVEPSKCAYDSNNNLCIPSTDDFTFSVYISNPNNVQEFVYRAKLTKDEDSMPDEEVNSLIDTDIEFTYNFELDPNVFYIKFKKDYLKGKDVDGQREFFTYIQLARFVDGMETPLPQTTESIPIHFGFCLFASFF